MATACATSSERRSEILEWHSRLTTLADHELLGVSPECDAAALRSAFARLARRFHPDTVGPSDADLQKEVQSIFIRINEAFRELSARRIADGRACRPFVGPKPAERVESRVSFENSAPPPTLGGAVAGRKEGASKAISRPPEWRRERVEEALGHAADLLAQQLIEPAVETLHEVVSLASGTQRRRVRLLLAHAYLSEKRWMRNGLALLRNATNEDPGDAEALALLGAAYWRQGLLAPAEWALRRAIAADPRNAEARSALRAVRAARFTKDAASRLPKKEGWVRRVLALARRRE